MKEAKQKSGPTLRKYMEKRFELLEAVLKEMEKNVDEKFTINREEREAYRKVLSDRFTHVQEIFTLAQSEQKRAVDKQEIAQAAHNVSMNEWHKTVNELMSISISRPEFERWVTEFSSYRLEASRATSATQGERRGAKEVKESNLAQLSLISGAVGTISAIAVSFILRTPVPAPTPQVPQVVVVPTPAPVQPVPQAQAAPR